MYLHSILKWDDGVVSLLELKKAMLSTFPDLSALSLSTLWLFITKKANLSKSRTNMRSARIYCSNRGDWIRSYWRSVDAAESTDVDIISIDESAFMHLWSEISIKSLETRGASNIVVNKAIHPTRYTLLLAVSRKGFFMGQLVNGSCTALLFAKFLLGIKDKYKLGSFKIVCENARIHRSDIVKGLIRASELEIVYTAPYFPDGCLLS